LAGGRMSIMTTRRRKSPEQIVRLLGQADQLLANGEDLASVCRTLGISESSFHRWRARYGGMNVDDAKRLKELEAESATLKLTCPRLVHQCLCESGVVVVPI